MPSIFARYLAYNIPILQTTDIMVSSNVWSMLYVMSSNSKCMCAAFRPLSYRRASQQCEYPVSGLVWFRLEQMSAVTDSVGEQWWAEHTITNRNVIPGPGNLSLERSGCKIIGFHSQQPSLQ